MAVARAEGLAAVTMRRVAAELDTGAASLYVYVRNRDELLRGMLDRVAGAIPLVKPDKRRWRKQRHDLLDAFRVGLETYPAWPRCCPRNRWPPTAPWPRSRTCSACWWPEGSRPGRGLGLRQPDADRHRDRERGRRPPVRRSAGMSFDDDFIDRLRSTFRGMRPEDYPNIVSHADALVAGTGAERFHFAIEPSSTASWPARPAPERRTEQF